MRKEKMAYLAGDLLKKGSILLRQQEAQEIRELGLKVYSPTEDKSINDKSNQTEESNNGLAERIVKNDTRGILESDVIVIEPHENALGTMVELGQIKGYKDVAKMLQEALNYSNNEDELIGYIKDLITRLDKKVYPHIEDIRRTNIPECGDRRSWGVNQYVYGCCLSVTDGKGLYEWDEIINELRKEV